MNPIFYSTAVDPTKQMLFAIKTSEDEQRVVLGRSYFCGQANGRQSLD